MVLLAASPAASISENDANTRGDASDSFSAPTPLSSLSRFSGSLHPSDADWYLAPAPTAEPICAIGAIEATGAGEFTLAVGPHRVTSPHGAWSSTNVSLAGTGATVLGEVATGADALKWQGYTVLPTVYRLSALGTPDAGTGVDAGATPSTALPFNAPCLSGRLSPVTFDSLDAYSFVGSAGERVVYAAAVASGDLQVRLFDPSGMMVGSPIGAGDVGNILLPTSGTYTMSVSATNVGTEPVDYVVSLVGGGPGNPCRPACATS